VIAPQYAAGSVSAVFVNVPLPALEESLKVITAPSASSPPPVTTKVPFAAVALSLNVSPGVPSSNDWLPLMKKVPEPADDSPSKAITLAFSAVNVFRLPAVAWFSKCNPML